MHETMDEGTRFFVVVSVPDNDKDSEFGYYAIARLGRAALDAVARRRAMFLAAKTEDEALTCLLFEDDCAGFYPAGSTFNVERPEEASFEHALGDEDFAEVPRDRNLPEPAPAKGRMVVVGATGVAWQAVCPETGVTASTFTIPYEVLFGTDGH